MLNILSTLSTIFLTISAVSLTNQPTKEYGYVILNNESSITYEESNAFPFVLPNNIEIIDLSTSLTKDELIKEETRRKIFFLSSDETTLKYFFNSLKTNEDIFGFDFYNDFNAHSLKGERIIPNDSYLYKQWSLEKVHAYEAWNIETGSKDASVGIIDTGIDKNNKDLSPNFSTELSDGIGFLSGDPGVDPDGHGTNVAGIIGAKGNNGIGFTGICWDVNLVSLKLPLINNKFMSWDIVDAINRADELNLPIINYSIGGEGEDLSIKQAIENYEGLFVCAAGNENYDIDEVFYSVGSFTLDNIICVGNSDRNNNKYSNSSYGKNSVDLFAPGVGIYNTYPNDEYDVSYTGTSQSTPLVAGAAALLLSDRPNLTTSELKSAILDNVTKVSSLSSYCKTGGILNVEAALRSTHIAHLYDRNYSWLNYDKHLAECRCGQPGFMSHIVSGNKPYGSKYYECLLCGGSAEIGLVIQTKNSILENRGYVVSDNGVIVVNDDLAQKIKNNEVDIHDLFE